MDQNRKVKLFVDTGDMEAIISHLRSGKAQGATTNPTLMNKAGITDYVGYAQKLLGEISEEPISFEVFAETFDEMERQAREIARWGQNVYVKIPVMDIYGHDSYQLVKCLSNDGIKLNVTAIMTVAQVEAVADRLRGGAPSIVSVFAGRIADTGVDPIPAMKECLDLCWEAGPGIELLWASPRETLNIAQADEIGCHIITATPDVIKKYYDLNGKDLHQFSLETVQMFDRDAKAAGFQL